MVTTFRYKSVESHMEQHKHWNQPIINQQLNFYCDTLAKRSVWGTLNPRAPPFGKQVLPRESLKVFIGGIKQDSDVAQEARFALGIIYAIQFNTIPLGQCDTQGRQDENGGLVWTTDDFDSVDWRALDATLTGKPNMYKL